MCLAPHPSGTGNKKRKNPFSLTLHNQRSSREHRRIFNHEHIQSCITFNRIKYTPLSPGGVSLQRLRCHRSNGTRTTASPWPHCTRATQSACGTEDANLQSQLGNEHRLKTSHEHCGGGPLSFKGDGSGVNGGWLGNVEILKRCGEAIIESPTILVQKPARILDFQGAYERQKATWHSIWQANGQSMGVWSTDRSLLNTHPSSSKSPEVMCLFVPWQTCQIHLNSLLLV